MTVEKQLNSTIQPICLKTILITCHCFLRVAEWLGLGGTSGDHLVQVFFFFRKEMKLFLFCFIQPVVCCLFGLGGFLFVCFLPVAVEVWRPGLHQDASCSSHGQTTSCKYSQTLDGIHSIEQLTYSPVTECAKTSK